MFTNEEKLIAAERKNSRSVYEATKLSAAQKNIHVFAVVASVGNFLFLVCDMIFIQGQTERLISAVLRYVFSILLILMIRKLQRIQSFARFSAVVSLLEAIGVVLFFFILRLYNKPNFMIQSMGMILAILAIFIVPNRCGNMMALSITFSVTFYAVWFIFMKGVDQTDFIAAVFYSVLTIVICAVRSIGTDRTAQQEFDKRAELEQASTRDYLTNAATRERLEEESRRWMSFCRRQGLPLCLVFVDLDDLKRINDRYGHVMGDIALKEVAALMKKQLRNSDTIARWGGDEFVLLLPNVTLQNAVLLLDRVKAAVNQLTIEGSVSVSCSFGVVQMGPESTYAGMLSQADALMYHAKRNGKGRISYPEAQDEAARSHTSD